MIAWTIAQIALLGGLLALAAWGGEAALRAAGRPTRWAWVGALVTTLALAMLTPLRRGSDTPLVTVTSAVTTAAANTTPVAAPSGLRVTLADTWYRLTALGERAVQDAWAVWHGAVPPSTERVLLVAWLLASTALLIAFVAVHRRFATRRAHWPVQTLLDTPVRVADDIGPAVIGVTRAEIVVPQWLLSRDAREQQLVLTHEREHVRLRDPLVLAIAQAVIVLLPWHPAVWWMASRLRLAVELDCDRRVLQRGASVRDYGTLLIDLTDHRTGFGAALPAFSCTPSHLERRLIAMTPKKLRYPLVRALCTGALASLALLAACEAKLPTAEEVDNMTAATATTAAGRVALMDSTNVTYVVNGSEVRFEAAQAIPADSIATINISRTNQGTGRMEIVTRQAGDSAGTMLRKREIDTTTAVRMGNLVFVPAEAERNGARPPGAGSFSASGSRQPFNGLVVLDGVISDMAAMNRLQPDQIASINIIKGAAATAVYSDPRAVNGVISVVTKAAAGDKRPLIKGTTPGAAPTATITTLRRGTPLDRSFSLPGAEVKSDGLTADINLNPNKFTGLVVLDGVLSSSSAMEALSADAIAGVTVLLGPAATAKYSDPRAANGVIEIVTKKP
jgi:beta-lactamase regulating signal transducer with metallopeptidase domain